MLVQDLVRIAKSAQSYIKENRSNLELTGIEQTVCLHIYLHKASNQDQLAKTLMMNKGNMAKILASLEQEGYVDRRTNPKNRRENIISLTAKGKELIKEVLELCLVWEEETLAMLTKEETEIFKTVCSKISQQVEE